MGRRGWSLGLAACLLLLAGTAPAGDASGAGARIYTERCSPCHGTDGHGDGPTAPALVPPPKNFHDPMVWKDRTDAQIRAIVKGGKVGTMMPPFQGVLSDAEIDAVVAYLHRFDPARGGGK